jgi:hypothetical protein
LQQQWLLFSKVGSLCKWHLSFTHYLPLLHIINMNEAVNNFAVQAAEADKMIQQKLTEVFESLVEPIQKVDDDLIVKLKDGTKPEDLLEKI